MIWGGTLRCGYHQDREAIGTCSNCGRGVCVECSVPVNGRYVCKRCSETKTYPGPQHRKEPFLALIFSFFIPGLGQIYNGETNNGILLIVVTVASWIATSVCIGVFIFIGVWVYAMYDAYTKAEKINRGEIPCAG